MTRKDGAQVAAGRTKIREIQKAWYDGEFGPLVTWRALVLQGWTAATIRELLGEPDCLGVNPDGGPRVKLYSEARVLRAQEEARATAAWTSGQRGRATEKTASASCGCGVSTSRPCSESSSPPPEGGAEPR